MTETRGEPADPLAARALAIAVLERVERDRAYADVTLDRALTRSRLAVRDRALATRLVYGTLAWQGRLDWHLAQLVDRPPAELDPPLRIVLRLGLYQILLLGRIPPHAAVATSVDLAKRLAPAASGLVNAVLRRAAREARSLPTPDPVRERLRHLAVVFSHPDWLIARWDACFPDQELRALLAADNEPAPTVLRTRIGARERALRELAHLGAAPCRYAPDGVRVTTAAPHHLSGHAQGTLSVQSEASQLVARLVAPERNSVVLDACAAPGGKTTYLAEMVAQASRVTALDRRTRGAAAIAASARRLGLSNVAALVGDARNAEALFGRARFDRILVDAPCTGLGTLRAHPEARWMRTSEDPARLASLQREILEGVTPCLMPGGVLVYAVCTITDEETEGVVRAWLAAHPDLDREDARPFVTPDLVDEQGALRTLPQRHDLDGFYAVRVRRRASPS